MKVTERKNVRMIPDFRPAMRNITALAVRVSLETAMIIVSATVCIVVLKLATLHEFGRAPTLLELMLTGALISAFRSLFVPLFDKRVESKCKIPERHDK